MPLIEPYHCMGCNRHVRMDSVLMVPNTNRPGSTAKKLDHEYPIAVAIRLVDTEPILESDDYKVNKNRRRDTLIRSLSAPFTPRKAFKNMHYLDTECESSLMKADLEERAERRRDQERMKQLRREGKKAMPAIEVTGRNKYMLYDGRIIRYHSNQEIEPKDFRPVFGWLSHVLGVDMPARNLNFEIRHTLGIMTKQKF